MKIKVDIVSGFLGAGKTSLIQKLVAEGFKGEKIVVIENEFGKVGIDGALLKSSIIQVRELGSGCICCSLADDLMTSIITIYKELSPDRIIIEPSGVALLSDVKRILELKEMADIAEPGMIITVVDASRFNIYRAFAKEFVENQIKSSQTLILSKTAGVDDGSLENIVKELDSINSDSNIITTDWQELDASEIISAANTDFRSTLKQQTIEHLHAHSHHERGPGCTCGCTHNHHLPAGDIFESWETITLKKYCREGLNHIFSELKNKEKYGIILRGKGILETPDKSWIHFDYVPYELKLEDYKINYTGMICLIGMGLNKKNIADLFDNN